MTLIDVLGFVQYTRVLSSVASRTIYSGQIDHPGKINQDFFVLMMAHGCLFPCISSKVAYLCC